MYPYTLYIYRNVYSTYTACYRRSIRFQLLTPAAAAAAAADAVELLTRRGKYLVTLPGDCKVRSLGRS